MQTETLQDIDLASEFIFRLQGIKKELMQHKEASDPGLLQQFLDEEDLYVKLIPRDNCNHFRVFADHLFLSQTQYLSLAKNFASCLQSRAGLHELESLLLMITSQNFSDYSHKVANNGPSIPEVDVVLMAWIFKVELTVRFLNEKGLQTTVFRFSRPSDKHLTILVGEDGLYDIVYPKSAIKTAGICQSILLETLDKVLYPVSSILRAPVYQNFEFRHWKAEIADGSRSRVYCSSTNDSLGIKFTALDLESTPDKKLLRKKRAGPKLHPDSNPSIRKQVQSMFSADFGKTYGSNEFDPIQSKETVSFATPHGPTHELFARRNSDEHSVAQPKPPSFRPSMERPPLPGAAYPNTFSYPTMTMPYSYSPMYFPVMMQPSLFNQMYSTGPPPSGAFLTGQLKFFDEAQNFGFFIVDSDGTDLFFHYDDLVKAGIGKEILQAAKTKNIKFMFRRNTYYGRYSLSYKAVDIQLLK